MNRIWGWLADRIVPARAVRYAPPLLWYSQRRGIHDTIAHAGWCARPGECRRVEL